jgi:hypothetical protein
MTAATVTLYRFYDQNDVLLYVGISDNWARRAEAHARAKGWWPQVASMKLEEFPNRKDAFAAEARAIFAEKPRYNGDPGPKPTGAHQHTHLGPYDSLTFACSKRRCPHPDQQFVDYFPDASTRTGVEVYRNDGLGLNLGYGV